MTSRVEARGAEQRRGTTRTGLSRTEGTGLGELGLETLTYQIAGTPDLEPSKKPTNLHASLVS